MTNNLLIGISAGLGLAISILGGIAILLSLVYLIFDYPKSKKK